jgi:general secretion pathway protein I
LVAQRQNGFTLIEVMVALVIVALSLTAVTASMSQMIDASQAMRDRTYASWIALNRIAEFRLAS